MTEQTFGGETFDPKLDGPRLKGQLEAVRNFMLDGCWHELSHIALETGTSMLSVGARVRDLRKPQFGGYIVEMRRVSGGLWYYRLAGRVEAKVEPAVQAPPVEVKVEPVAPVEVKVEAKPRKRKTRDQKWASDTMRSLMGDLFERVEAERAAVTSAVVSTVARHMMESRS